jgi:RNA chaperone Hfq
VSKNHNHKTLEEIQFELVEFLEKEGGFEGSVEELARVFEVSEDKIVQVLKVLSSSGDIVYEETGGEVIIKPSFAVAPVSPSLTPEQEKEVNELVEKGYKLVACSYLGGLQSRELRNIIGKRVIIYFRNGSRVEGKLKGFDRFTLKVRNYMGNMLIYKHSISTIVYKG